MSGYQIMENKMRPNFFSEGVTLFKVSLGFYISGSWIVPKAYFLNSTIVWERGWPCGGLEWGGDTDFSIDCHARLAGTCMS